MASFLSSLCCCSFGRDPNEDEINERTALLNPDVLPEAPAQFSGRTSEQQLAEQNALRSILNDASERFVNVSSPSPFSRDSPYSSRSASPTLEESSYHQSHQPYPSTWRPSVPDPPIKVVHLGTAFEPHASAIASSSTTPRRSKSPYDRPTSSHSLKTLPKDRGGTRPSPLGASEGGDSGSDGESQGGTYKAGFNYSMREGSKYGTGTYKTARESRDDDEGDGTVHKVRKSKRIEKRGKVKDLWTEENATAGGVEVENISLESGETTENDIEDGVERQAELDKALVALEESLATFKLTPVGPLVESLSDASDAT